MSATPYNFFAEVDIAALIPYLQRLKTEVVLQLSNSPAKQFNGHRLISDFGLEILNEITVLIWIAHLHAVLTGSEKIIAPLSELCGGDAKFATERIKVLATQYSQDDINLATA